MMTGRFGPSIACCIALVLPSSGCILTLPGASVRFDSPVERQVFQRDPGDGAEFPIVGVVTGPGVTPEIRVRLADGSTTPWQRLNLAGHAGPGRRFDALVRVPSGGWHVVEWRASPEDAPTVGVRRVGVGEVFVVAGQSNSTNCGDMSMPVSNDLVSAFGGDLSWRRAADPMPGVQDGSTGGSPWPKFGDLLQRSLGVPVAIASVGHGNSSIFDWQPGPEAGKQGIGKALYPALRDRLESLGPVRAVLWHQGETDAREGVGKDEYVDAFKNLRAGLREDTGLDPPWVVANATFLTENTADGMESIRRAQQYLWMEGLALRGPDTDQLQGGLRKWDLVHFSRAGLRVHAELWYSMVWAQLFAAEPKSWCAGLLPGNTLDDSVPAACRNTLDRRSQSPGAVEFLPSAAARRE